MCADFSGIIPPTGLPHRTADISLKNMAVRLMALPQDLQQNATPLRLNATVIHKNADGTIQLQTERGVISVLLRDQDGVKAPPLQEGQRLQIDIPAGAPPRHASMLSLSSLPAASVQQNAPLNTTAAASVFLEPATIVKADMSLISTVKPDIASVLSNKGIIIQSELPVTLQAGQPVSLLPLPSTPVTLTVGAHAIEFPTLQAVQTLTPTLVTSSSSAPIEQAVQFLSAVIHTINALPADMQAVRSNILHIISNTALDIPFLMAQDSSHNPTLSTVQHYIKQYIAAGELPELTRLPTYTANASTPAAGPVILPAILQQSLHIASTQISGNLSPSLHPIMDGLTAHVLGFISNAGLNGTHPSSSQTAIFASTPVMHALQQQTHTTTIQTALSNDDSITPQAPFIALQVVGETPQKLPVLTPIYPPSVLSAMQAKNITPPLYVMPQAITNLSNGSPVFVVIDSVTGDIDATVIPRHHILPIAPPVIPPSAISSLSMLFSDDSLWAGLDDLLQFSAQASIQAPVSHLLQSILPNSAQPQNFPKTSLFFLSALTSGDFESWAGNELFSRLKSDPKNTWMSLLPRNESVAMARTALQETPLQEWRAFVLPFVHEQHVHKLPFYYRKWEQEDSTDQKRRQKMLRFLFDLKLSRMGKVQVDGYMQDKRMDLILRTETPLSSAMQHHIRQAYSTAIDKSAMTGELNFQNRMDQWLIFDIIPEKEAIGI